MKLQCGVALLLLVGCYGPVDPMGTRYIDPYTGETRDIMDGIDAPQGWESCDELGRCPEPLACEHLGEAACLIRQDCRAANSTAPPSNCPEDDPRACAAVARASCESSRELCSVAECGPRPVGINASCDGDAFGSLMGSCVRLDSGGCGWEARGCP